MDALNLLPAPVRLADMDGRCIWVNRAWVETTGQDASEAAGHGWLKRILADDTATLMQSLRQAATEKRPYAVEYRLLDHAHRPCWFREEGTVRLDDTGDVSGLVAVAVRLAAPGVELDNLVRQKQLLQLILDTLPVGVWILDRNGTIMQTNPAGKAIWGDALFVGPERYREYRGWWPESGKRLEAADWAAARTITRGESTLNELVDIETFDGKRKTILNFSVPIIAPTGEQDGVVVVNSDFTSFRTMEKALETERDKLRQLSRHLQSVREEERTRIAREIHDELGQSLATTLLGLSLLSGELRKDQQPLRDRCHDIEQQISATIKTVQRVCAELRPPLLDDLGLIEALEWQAAQFMLKTGIHCRLNNESNLGGIDRETTTTLFRIFQEALTNVIRHAKARHVETWLIEKRRHLLLAIRDDGCGIRPGEIRKATAFGLIGMRERLTALDGQLRIVGRPGRGTTIFARIPKPKGSTP